MGSFLELTASDNHKFSAYLAQPDKKTKSRACYPTRNIWSKYSYSTSNRSLF
jgi:hypothetical protein